ncbi:MAG: hypothetical protein KC620_19685, partial [Myxococcales bacterium]|nr:hypothetical protein [Myxococcales bacterium]
CCAETDCPVGFGCLYNRGVRLCLPSRIFPPGFTFDASVGQPCRGTACRSGLCDGQRDRCLGTCCVDDDCGAGGLCQWLLAGGTQRLACDPLPFGFGRTGDPCGNEFDCQSRVCVWPGQCADLCCTHADCPGATGCGQVAAFDLNGNISGKVTACTPLPRGETVDGEVCIGDEDCQSGWCIGNVCVEPCCADADCIPPQRCLPRVTPDRVLARVCVEPDPP